jgi:hypothetical protein
MIASTAQRVPQHTDEDVNRRIEVNIIGSVHWHAARPERIDRRLRELDNEWDIERAIEANASTLAFVGVALGATVDKRWLLLPALVTGFLFQHALQGWCPPVPVLRRLGFRTAREIDIERTALKALRGDFDRVREAGDQPGLALAAAER